MSANDGNADDVVTTINPEDKLDEDFLFYMAYTHAFFNNLEESQEVELCEAWLLKLCAQSVAGIRAKRSRNIYLSNLILGMLEGQLSGPFNGLPPKGHLPDALQIFAPDSPPLDEDELEDELSMFGVDVGNDFNHTSSDGRTYVASKTLPNGRGAFGFISITLGEQEEECDPCESNKESKEDDELPDDVRSLLASRSPEALRNRLVRFYNDMIVSIDNELKGTAIASPSVNLMIDNMDSEMRCMCNKEKVWEMCPDKRRKKMLELVRGKIKSRKEKVYARGLALDDLEAMVKSKQREFGPQDEILFQEANADIKPRNMKKLKANYPDCVNDRLNELLKKEKRRILERERDRLLNFEKEVEKDQIAIIKEGRDKYMATKREWQAVAEVVDEVRKAIKYAKEEKVSQKAVLEKSAQDKKHTESLLQELSREQEAYELTLKNNKHLRDLIQEESDKSEGVVACSAESRERMRRDNNALRKEIQDLQSENNAKEERVKELQQMVDRRFGNS